MQNCSEKFQRKKRPLKTKNAIPTVPKTKHNELLTVEELGISLKQMKNKMHSERAKRSTPCDQSLK